MNIFSLIGNIIDLEERRIFSGKVTVVNGVIVNISLIPNDLTLPYILPGFIDSHIHIESSMLIPSEFARIAVTHGTVATVSDPHEIGNVLGIKGVRYMLNNGAEVPFHFYFGAPSCVPATSFETAGATISSKEIKTLFVEDKLKYLSEMMNYPGILNEDPEVMEKIKIAEKLGLPIDGHAPGLMGANAAKYVAAGISTDHECNTLDEALGKLSHGMKILIREGSAAKNYNALHPLIASHPDMVMFCSDDKHPHELVKGHINELVKRSVVDYGYDLMDVLRCACYHPIKHYKLDVGLLQKGDSADFIVVNNLKEFSPLKTYIKGVLVAKNGKTLIPSIQTDVINNFNISKKKVEDFSCHSEKEKIHVILAFDGELITGGRQETAKKEGDLLVSDTDCDILKLVVVNRYKEAPVSIGFIHGFGLKTGALASCIGHDSHNIIAVGVNDEEICCAVNKIIEHKGGISVTDGKEVNILPLPIAGIMSQSDAFEVAAAYAKIDAQAKELGTELQAPFMTLSFMALLVIPSLKLSDQGLFDGSSFSFIPL